MLNRFSRFHLGRPRVSAPAPPSISTPYADAVNALAPIAYFKLHESASGPVADETGTYTAATSGALSYRWPGPTKDADDYAMRSEGGVVDISGGLEADLLSSPAWSVSCWYYPNGDDGYLMYGARNGTSRFSISYSTGSLRATSDSGGQDSLGSDFGANGWHHLVLTSAGDMYVDGVATSGTSGANLNSTVGFQLFARAGSFIYQAWLAHVACFDFALTGAQALALHDAGRLGAGERAAQRTVYWDCEDMVVADSARGLGLHVYSTGGSAILSALKARSGTKSILCNTAFSSTKIWHDLPYESWAPLSEGTVRFWVNYNALPVGNENYMFWDGKTGAASPLDSNNAAQVRWNHADSRYEFSIGGSLATVSPAGLATGVWYEIIARHRVTGGGNKLELSVNGDIGASTTAPDFTGWTTNEWHSWLFGNDLTGSSPDYHADDFEIWNYWNDSI